MDKNFFEGLIRWKIEKGDMSPFGWYADIFEFTIDEICENPVLDTHHEYPFVIECSSENLENGKTMNKNRFRKNIYLTNDEINEYISHSRDSKINSLGI